MIGMAVHALECGSMNERSDMSGRVMVEGRVATVFTNEDDDKVRFTVENGETLYYTTSQHVEFLRMPDVFVRFYHEQDISGVTYAENLHFRGMPLPSDQTLDTALYQNLRWHLRVIASMRRSSAFMNACGDAADGMTALSKRAGVLLDDLDAVADAETNPSPSNPALTSIYRELKEICSELSAVLVPMRLLGMLAADPIVKEAISAENYETMRKVESVAWNQIDRNTIPSHRFMMLDALSSFEAEQTATAG
jgi:hypothetical protein